MFTLIRSYEFDLAVPTTDIEKRSSIVVRPYVKGEFEKGSQLPLMVKKVASVA